MITAVLLILTSVIVIKITPKVFETNTQNSEASQIKWTVLLFVTCFILRGVLSATFQIMLPQLKHLDITLVQLGLASLSFWIVTELTPITYVLYTHH